MLHDSRCLPVLCNNMKKRESFSMIDEKQNNKLMTSRSIWKASVTLLSKQRECNFNFGVHLFIRGLPIL